MTYRRTNSRKSNFATEPACDYPLMFDSQGERQRVAHQLSDAPVFGGPALSHVQGVLAWPPSNFLPHRHGSVIEHDARPADIRRIITGEEDCGFAP
jgi:hypothetical protein